MSLRLDSAPLLGRAASVSDRRKASILCVGLLAAAACCPAVAGQPTTPFNVTTIVHDVDAAGNLLLMRSDDYKGYLQATYTTTTTHNGMTSLMWDNAGWRVLLGGQTLRTIWLTLKSQVPSINLPDGYYSASVEIYASCHDSSGNEVPLLAIPPLTANNNCLLGVDFSTGGSKYKLEMGQPFSGPLTGLATVSCNGGSPGACNSWTITPYTGGSAATVANLYQYATHGLVYIGAYHNTFRIDVTNP